MGFFSIIETFFFISLGITIILVALLVYHFKQRLSLVEQKYETLFDIIAGVVKQLSNIQSASNPVQSIGQVGGIYQHWIGQEHLGNITVSTEYPHQTFNTIEEQYSYNNLQVQSKPTKNNNVEVEDDESIESTDSDESDEFDDSESELNHSDEDGNSEDSEESEIDKTYIDNDGISKIIVSDDELTNLQNINGDSVKIISLNVSETYPNIEGLEFIPINVDDNQDTDDTYECPVQDVQIDYSLTVEKEESSIVVLKVDDIQNEHADNTFVIERSSAKDLYKKMSLSNLKATVISKGLCSDPSKMKKNELLKLLEDE